MNELNPAASQHLPSFITAPGETDVLMVVLSVILVLSVMGFGNLFFRLHTMPERMAHRGHKIQFEIVAVLGLLALFTHVHLFWIGALLLAMIDVPDFGTPLRSIANSVEKIAAAAPNVVVDERSDEAEGKPAAVTPEKPEARASKAKVHGHA